MHKWKYLHFFGSVILSSSFVILVQLYFCLFVALLLLLLVHGLLTLMMLRRWCTQPNYSSKKYYIGRYIPWISWGNQCFERQKKLLHFSFHHWRTVQKHYRIVITSFSDFRIRLQNCRKFVFQAPFRTRRGGGGAPLRSSTGQIITKYRDDPNIAFSDSARKHVENHLRYKTSAAAQKQYKMDLDRCRAERMRRDAKNSLDMVCLCRKIVSDRLIKFDRFRVYVLWIAWCLE